jgi:pimeloyl-ACP methyl ester carboxylesterase
MTVKTCRNGAVELAYETFGELGGVPLVLIMGSGWPRQLWHDDFCLALVENGFQVARFDNRDSGLSSRVEHPYSLSDMAGDTVAVLDELGWPSAHLVGASLGGMIGQVMAVHHADRVRSLTSLSSAPCYSWRVSRPRIRALFKIAALTKRGIGDPGEFLVELFRIVGSPGYPHDEQWLRHVGTLTGHPDPGAGQRQLAAARASGDRRAELARVRVPTLVVHGEADPLQSVRAGHATAAAIPGARLVTYPGMGHDLPRDLWPAIVREIRDVSESHSVR